MPELNTILSPQWGVDTIFRWIITILALLMALYLSWRNASEKVQDKIISTQKEQLSILDTRNKSLKEENLEYKEKFIKLEADIKVLESKTDLSKVLDLVKSIQQTEGERHAEKLRTLGLMMEDMRHIIRAVEKKVDDVKASKES